MTDTTHTRTSPPGEARYRGPEHRLAVSALEGVRGVLITDAFAHRPLAPLAEDGALLRRLPAGMRGGARHLPFGLVCLLALLVLWLGVVADGPYGGFSLLLLGGLLCGVPVLMTAVRPVGAFWLSVAAAPLAPLVGTSEGEWPWLPGTFTSHLLVLVIVALRTDPRTIAWMWTATAAYGLLVQSALGGGHPAANTASMLVLSALVLLAVSLWHIRRRAREEVTAQQSVTEHERSRRTLLEERTTIARELHDVVAHHMSVVAVQAEAAPYRVQDPPEELERAFAVIRENAVAALTELRRVLGVVRAEEYEAPDAPQPTLADLGALLANVAAAGLAVDRAVTGAVRELPPGVELSAYRIVQEALSNTLRHAPGAGARVELSYVLGGLGLRIVNGPAPGGRPPRPSPGAGHGITGMRERVAMLDGEMTAGPAEDGGYEVAVFLPVTAAPAEAA
ncbi:histidine kinase [Streptomyces sp. SID8352]|uniref:histidine kinase n=1 Tax=Streptomyces sp. SID8352 TaxID=2690338 RepID=UPI00136B3082|nr:two-component sensor histidine kinase [Streptomyces sp. SID8352]